MKFLFIDIIPTRKFKGQAQLCKEIVQRELSIYFSFYHCKSIYTPHHLAAYTFDRASVPLMVHTDLQGSQHPLDIFRYLANFLKAPDGVFMQ